MRLVWVLVHLFLTFRFMSRRLCAFILLQRISPDCFFAGVCCGGLTTLPIQVSLGPFWNRIQNFNHWDFNVGQIVLFSLHFVEFSPSLSQVRLVINHSFFLPLTTVGDRIPDERAPLTCPYYSGNSCGMQMHFIFFFIP